MSEMAPRTTHAGSQARWEMWGLGLVMWLFIITLLGLPLMVWQTLNRHSAAEAFQQAKSIQAVIATVRSYYARQVIGRVQEAGGAVVVTEKFRSVHGGIPIPATFSIELGEELRRQAIGANITFHFVSDQPFLNRMRAPLDQFEADALRAFREASRPGTENPTLLRDGYWRLETNDDGRSHVRLAGPVRMEATCVACHNSHPDSPFKAWKVGDVRGIQEVSVAVDTHDQARLSVWLALYLGLLGLTGLLALRDHKASVTQLKSLNQEMDASRHELQRKGEVLERSVRELQTMTTVLDRAPFSILVFDPAGDEPRIDYANEAFLRSTGYPLSAIRGRHPRFLFGPDSEPTAVATLNQALTQHDIRDVEVLVYGHDGSSRMIRWLVFPSFSLEGTLLNMVACLNDITDIRASEVERARLIGELQESTKLEFLGLAIAGMAHDLNTPIGIAVTASSHIQQTAGKLSEALHKPDHDADQLQTLAGRLQRSAEMVTKNLGKAAELVQGFKRTSAEVTRNEWRQIDLGALIDSLVTTMSPVMRRAQCAVEVVCPNKVLIHTEPGALSQALTNLMVNATLHAFDDRSDRRLRLEVSDSDEAVKIVVADNGLGMSEEATVKAFTPFFTTKRGSGGSGLGLFSSRRAIETVLGGTLTMQSTPERGTAFYIQLPKSVWSREPKAQKPDVTKA